MIDTTMREGALNAAQDRVLLKQRPDYRQRLSERIDPERGRWVKLADWTHRNVPIKTR
jgi:hypothetical protein